MAPEVQAQHPGAAESTAFSDFLDVQRGRFEQALCR
jgi:hypothetical protein